MKPRTVVVQFETVTSYTLPEIRAHIRATWSDVEGIAVNVIRPTKPKARRPRRRR